MRTRPTRRARRQTGVLSHSLEPRRLLAIVTWDGGAGTLEWGDAANWSSNTLPTAADDVIIDIPGSSSPIRIGSASYTSAIVRSLQSAEPITLANGRLEIASESIVEGRLDMNGGVLATAAPLTLAGGMVLWSAVSIEGTSSHSGQGVIRLPAGTQSFIFSDSNSMASIRQFIELAGTLHVHGAFAFGDSIVSPSAESFRIVDGGILDIRTPTDSTSSDSIILATNSHHGELIIETGGRIENNRVGGGSTQLRVRLNLAGGEIRSDADTLAFIDGGILAGGTITSTSQGIRIDGDFHVTHDFEVDAAYFTVDRLSIKPNVTLTVNKTLRLLSAHSTIGGAGDLVVRGRLEWQDGNMIGSGSTRLSSSSVSRIGLLPGVMPRFTYASLSRVMEVEGILHVDRPLLFGAAQSLTPATLRIVDGGVVDLADSTRSYLLLIGAPSSSPDTPHSIEVDEGGTLQSSGRVQINAVMAGQNMPSVYLAGGTIRTSGTGKLPLGSLISHGGVIETTGTGWMTMRDVTARNGTTTFNGQATGRENTLNSNASLTVGAFAIDTDATLIVQGLVESTVVPFGNTPTPSIGGNGIFTLAGELVFSSGIQLPQVDIPAGATLRHVGQTAANSRFDTILNVAGTFVARNPAGSSIFGLLLPADAEINVRSGGLFRTTTSINRFIGTADPFTPGIINVDPGGTFNVSADTISFPTIAAPIRNAGTVQTIASGFPTFSRQDSPILTGTWNVGSSSLTFSTQYGGVLPTHIAGEFNLNTGTVNGLSKLNLITGSLTIGTGRSLSVAPDSGLIAIRDNGSVSLAAGATFNITGDLALEGDPGTSPSVRTTLAGDNSFGKVAISGALRLDDTPNALPSITVTLASGYDPALGTQFPILSATGGVIGAFDVFNGATTPGGNAITLVRPDANTIGVTVSAANGMDAPTVVSAAFENETRQAITINFDQDVGALLSRADFRIINVQTKQSRSLGVLAYDAATRQATLLLNGILPDGRYRLEIVATGIGNAAGIALSGSMPTVSFNSLAADTNSDGRVDFDDLLTLAQHYGQVGKTFSQGNIDYSEDGSVGFEDLLLLAQRYGSVLNIVEPAKPSTPARKREAVIELS